MQGPSQSVLVSQDKGSSFWQIFRAQRQEVLPSLLNAIAFDPLCSFLEISAAFVRQLLMS